MKKIEFNVTGPDRKNLVTTIGEILGVKPKYLGMPTAAYDVGGFTVDRRSEERRVGTECRG